MRVAVLGPYPLDSDVLGGGVEAAIVYLQRELAKLPQIDLHIIACSQALSEQRVAEGENCTVTHLPRGRLGRISGHRAEIAAIGSYLRRLAPDIVHGHMSGLYAGAALASPYPAVLTIHGIAFREARLQQSLANRLRGCLDARYERSVIRRAGHLILISPYVREVFAGILSGKTYLVENACDERFFHIARQPVAGRLLFVGPVIPRKGVLPLIEAMRWIRDGIPTAHLRVAGTLDRVPDYGRACRQRAEELGLGDEAVCFLGHLSQERILEEYSTCAGFVLPSFQETAPVAIAQAMAAGVPCVATRAGGVPWMIEDGLTGWTIAVPESLKGDPQTLATALLGLLQDPKAAGRVGRRARTEARERFLPCLVARRTLRVYQEVIAASG